MILYFFFVQNGLCTIPTRIPPVFSPQLTQKIHNTQYRTKNSIQWIFQSVNCTVYSGLCTVYSVDRDRRAVQLTVHCPDVSVHRIGPTLSLGVGHLVWTWGQPPNNNQSNGKANKGNTHPLSIKNLAVQSHIPIFLQLFGNLTESFQLLSESNCEKFKLQLKTIS